MLNIVKTINENEAVFALEGRLDTVTAPDLDQEIKDLPAEITALVLDFEQLEYISSAGLRVLLASQKKMDQNGSMKVTRVNDTVMEIFEVTGFSEILTIE